MSHSSDLIVVTTNRGREAWAYDMAKSIDRDHIILSVDGGWELAKLKWCLEHTTFDRFIFLQDAMLILDNTVFDRIAATPGSICLNHFGENHFMCFMGVYERVVLERMDFPECITKEDSTDAEWIWNTEYVRQAEVRRTRDADHISCWDPITPWGPAQMRRGRMNIPHDMGYAVKFRSIR